MPYVLVPFVSYIPPRDGSVEKEEEKKRKEKRKKEKKKNEYKPIK